MRIAFHPFSKCPRKLIDVWGQNFRIISPKLPTLHYLFREYITVSFVNKSQENVGFKKPTDDSLTQSLEAKVNHANAHQVSRITMPEASCGMDRLRWYKMESLIKEVYGELKLTNTVYDLNNDEQSKKSDEIPVHSALGKSQRRNEAFSKIIQWIKRGKALTPRELQGFRGLHSNSKINSIVYNWSMEVCAAGVKLEKKR